MERQKVVLKTMSENIVISSSVLTMDLYTFNSVPHLVRSGVDNASGVNDAIDAVYNEEFSRARQSNFIKLFALATKHLPTDGIVVLISDGRPYSKRKTKASKLVKSSCNAVQKFRRTRGDAKVLCMQPSDKQFMTPFLKCACDYVWASFNDSEDNGIDMADKVCDVPVAVKNPCLGHNSKSSCMSIHGDPKSGVIDPALRSRVCKWRRKKCYVSKAFTRFY
jgi:hypothetical protein